MALTPPAGRCTQHGTRLASQQTLPAWTWTSRACPSRSCRHACHHGSARYRAVEQDRARLCVQAIEDRCNAEIRAARPVSAVVLREGEGDHAILQSPDLRGAVPPFDVVRELRLLHIHGLDVNACGGTHVANTAELQVCPAHMTVTPCMHDAAAL